MKQIPARARPADQTAECSRDGWHAFGSLALQGRAAAELAAMVRSASGGRVRCAFGGALPARGRQVRAVRPGTVVCASEGQQAASCRSLGRAGATIRLAKTERRSWCRGWAEPRRAVCPRPVAASAAPGLLPCDRPPPVLAEELVEGLSEQGLDRPARPLHVPRNCQMRVPLRLASEVPRESAAQPLGCCRR